MKQEGTPLKGRPFIAVRSLFTGKEGISMNYTYILTCADGTFYCGWTNDLDKRLKVHNQGKGAKYTKPRRPVVLSYYEAFETKQEAMSREYAIKHMSRAEKEHLIKKTGFQRTS